MKGPLMHEKIIRKVPADKGRNGSCDGEAVVPQPESAAHPAATPGQRAETMPDSRAHRRLANLRLLGAAALSGLALSACFFPLSQAWLAWIALVPLLPLVRAQASRLWVYFCALVGGSLFFWPALSWMPESNDFMRMAWYGLSLYCSLYLVVTVWLLRLIDRRTRLPLIVSLPAVWVGLEYVRSFLLTGFPWYFLAHTQHYLLPVIQVADLGGAYLVSFLVAMVNGLVFEWIYLDLRVRSLFRLRHPDSRLRYTRMPSWIGWQTAAVVGVLILTLAYGWHRLQQDDFADGPLVALLQGNIDQNVRNDASATEADKAGEAAEKIAHGYDPLWRYAAQKYHKKVDLMIWPETSFPACWRDTKKGIQPFQEPDGWQTQINDLHWFVRKFATDPKACNHTNLLLGMNSMIFVDPEHVRDPKGFKEYNSALLVNADGTFGGRYDKIHRIPFGEYIPLREDWPWLAKFTPYEGFDYQISAGQEMKRFKLGNYKFGVLICYEDTDPSLARQYGAGHADGPPVDFLVNMSNDGWYAGTSEHNEHLAISRFRAVETRKALARAVNMGISAVIDPNGRVQKPFLIGKVGEVHEWDIALTTEGIPTLPLSEWNEFKQRTGVITAVIPIDHRISLYSLWGDWFANTCAAVAAVGVGMAVLPWKRLRPLT